MSDAPHLGTEHTLTGDVRTHALEALKINPESSEAQKAITALKR